LVLTGGHFSFEKHGICQLHPTVWNSIQSNGKILISIPVEEKRQPIDGIIINSLHRTAKEDM